MEFRFPSTISAIFTLIWLRNNNNNSAFVALSAFCDRVASLPWERIVRVDSHVTGIIM